MILSLPRRGKVSESYGEAYRYSEEHTGKRFAKVMPGFLYVTRGDEFISTTLGSCIAVCLRDAETGVAGMNHFLLPDRPRNQAPRSNDAPGDANRYGDQAIASLIEGMIRCGAREGHMQSKIFGGGRVLDFSESIGLLNAVFATGFLLREGIPILASDVGGTTARKIVFEPRTGQVRVLKLAERARETVVSTEKRLFATTSP